jgi:D-glycero-D-manno-heptose 1,7-bisphosphate phosphatase
MKKCVFLDRDGVLNQDPPHYVHKIEDMVILSRVGEAIKLLNDNGFLVIVVSNQSGVGRGKYTKKDVEIFHTEMKSRLYDGYGAWITDFFYCPHTKEENCMCRKPKPEMLLNAAYLYSIDLPNSWLIGDKRTDCEAADAAGVRSILVLTGHGQEEVKKPGSHRVSNDLYSAVTEYIVDVK